MLFRREPKTQEQRDRWITLIDLVSNHNPSTIPEIQALLESRGHSVATNTLINDLKAANIVKWDGSYRHIPAATSQVLEDVLSARLRIAAEQVHYSGDLVIINCNRGSATWLAEPLKELKHDDIVSYNEGTDALWILASQNRGRAVYRLIERLYTKGTA